MADNPINGYYGQNTSYLPPPKWWVKLEGEGGEGGGRKERRGHYFFTSLNNTMYFAFEIFPNSSIVSSRNEVSEIVPVCVFSINTTCKQISY